MASNVKINTFSSREAMASSVAVLIASKIKERANDGESAELAVSGGSTPLALYQELARLELDWPNIRLTLVDERWVPLDHPRSNEAFVRKAFEQVNCGNIQGLYMDLGTIDDAVSRLNSMYSPLKSHFDVVVLGIGNDGHTASWFPYAEGLESALGSEEAFCTISAQQSEVTGEEVQRVSLTFSAIKQTPLIVLLLAGNAKYETLKSAQEPGPVDEMPVRAILNARPDMHICYAP